MKFDTNNVFLFQTGNHNSLILNEVARFFDYEHTILLKFTPDLVRCKANVNLGTDHVGCPIAMNGKHIGLFYKINNDREAILFEWWEIGKEGEEFKSIELDFPIPYTARTFDVILRRNKDTFVLSANGKTTTGETGTLSGDYTHSILWLGAATMYSEEHSFPFIGDMEKIHITKEALNNKEVQLFFNDYSSFVADVSTKPENSTLFTTSFEQTTYFKIMDESNNGNHPILFKKEWID